jgi:putative protease
LTKSRAKPHCPVRQLKPTLKHTKSIEKPKQKTPQVPVGEITHYFPKIQVAVLKIKKGSLLVMDPIRIEGKLTNFNQTVGSMQIDRKPIEKALRGDEIGLQVREPVQPGDIVFKLKS